MGATTTRPIYCRGVLAGTKAAGSGEKVFKFRATTALEDRQGEVVAADGWLLDDFRKNPVFLWAHDYSRPPIGKVVAVEQDADGLMADVVFDEADPFAQLVRGKYEKGILNAVSVGFMSLEMETPKRGEGPLVHRTKSLLELSAVPIPANPEALMQRGLLSPQEAWRVDLVDQLAATIMTELARDQARRKAMVTATLAHLRAEIDRLALRAAADRAAGLFAQYRREGGRRA